VDKDGDVRFTFKCRKQPQQWANRAPKYEISCIRITGDNLLFTGESKKVRLWDLRASCSKAQTSFKPDNDREERKTIQPDIFLIPPKQTKAATTKLRFQESLELLVASFTSFNGIASFDIRSPKHTVEIYDYHYYPVSAFDTGNNFNEHIAISSGTTNTLSHDLKVIDLRLPKEKNAHTKFSSVCPAVVTKLFIVSAWVMLIE
jgi:WD40 repeat protein